MTSDGWVYMKYILHVNACVPCAHNVPSSCSHTNGPPALALAHMANAHLWPCISFLALFCHILKIVAAAHRPGQTRLLNRSDTPTNTEAIQTGI